MEFKVGDKVKTKKVHPCGSYDFEIIISRTDKWGVNSLSKFMYKILY